MICPSWPMVLICLFPTGVTSLNLWSRFYTATRDSLSPSDTLHWAWGPDACWPEQTPCCSLFHNALMKFCSQGHWCLLHNLPLFKNWETNGCLGPLYSPTGESNQSHAPLEFQGGETEPKAHFSLVSLRNSYWLALCNIRNGPPVLLLCLTHRSMNLWKNL